MQWLIGLTCVVVICYIGYIEYQKYEVARAIAVELEALEQEATLEATESAQANWCAFDDGSKAREGRIAVNSHDGKRYKCTGGLWHPVPEAKKPDVFWNAGECKDAWAGRTLFEQGIRYKCDGVSRRWVPVE